VKLQIMQTGENSIIEARILSHSTKTCIHSALICNKFKFMALWLNTKINPSTLFGPLHLI